MTIALLITGFLLGVGFSVGMLAVAICTGGIEVDDSILGSSIHNPGSSTDVPGMDKD